MVSNTEESRGLRGLQAHKQRSLSSMLHDRVERHGRYCHFKETLFTNVHLRHNCLALTMVAAVKHFWINNNFCDYITIIYYQSKSMIFVFFVYFILYNQRAEPMTSQPQKLKTKTRRVRLGPRWRRSTRPACTAQSSTLVCPIKASPPGATATLGPALSQSLQSIPTVIPHSCCTGQGHEEEEGLVDAHTHTHTHAFSLLRTRAHTLKQTARQQARPETIVMLLWKKIRRPNEHVFHLERKKRYPSNAVNQRPWLTEIIVGKKKKALVHIFSAADQHPAEDLPAPDSSLYEFPSHSYSPLPPPAFK